MDDLWGNAWNDSPKVDVQSTENEEQKLEAESEIVTNLTVPVWHATEPEENWQPEIGQKTTVWGNEQSPWTIKPVADDEESRLPPDSPLQTPEVEQSPSLPASSTIEVRTPSPEPDEPSIEPDTREEDDMEVLAPPFQSVSPTSPTPGSPDGFGSFETGVELVDESSWVAPVFTNSVSDNPGWVSEWHNEPEPQKDAWAVAQEEKIRRNKRVVSHFLINLC